MKPSRTLLPLSIAVCLGLGACDKTNDVARLQDEAVTVAKFHQPRIERLGKRIDAIFARGRLLPARIPGINEAGQLLGRARDKLITLRGIAASVDKQAEDQAKKGDADALEKLVDDTRDQLDTGATEVNDELDSIESWLAQAEAHIKDVPVVVDPALPPPGTDPPPAR